MYFLVAYNTQTTVFFPMVKRNVVDLAVSGDWTPTGSDTMVSIDGASDSYATNVVAAVPTATALWSLTLTAAETAGKLISVRIIDQGTKAVEDQALFFQTFGNAAASIVRNISTDPATANVTQWSGSSVATPDTAGYPKVTIKSGFGAGEIYLNTGRVDSVYAVASVSGAVGSVTGAVGSVTGAVGSVAGNVDGNVGGNVVGSVATVSGGVGGNVTGAVGSVTAAVAVTSNIKKNQALASYSFMMFDSTNHQPNGNQDVTVTRSIDGGAFAAGNISGPSELGSGVYIIDLAAADLNGNVITIKASATGNDDTIERIITAP